MAWRFVASPWRVRKSIRVSSRARFPGRNYPPIVGRVLFEQEDFKLSPGDGIVSAQASGDDFRVVHDQDITGMQVIGEIDEFAVRERMVPALNDQQPRLVALCCRVWAMSSGGRS